MTQKIRKVVMPVAGMGTRVLPATKVLPKEMLPLVDRPLIQNAVEEARAAGIEEFIFVSSRGKQMLEDHFDHHAELYAALDAKGKADMHAMLKEMEIESGKLSIMRQAQPLGLGHAVYCARAAVGDEPFAVILPDDVYLAPRGGKSCLAQMVEAYETHGGNLVAVEEVPKELTSRYGILDVASDDGKLAAISGLVEKPAPEDAPSNLSIVGRYILQPEVFTHLESGETGAGGEIQLTDAMANLIGSQPFNGLRIAATRYDCGSAMGLIEANVAFALARPDMAGELRQKLEILLEAADKAA